jgi:hypothetical protein
VQLLDEYYAPPEKRSKMTKKEVSELAQHLNKKVIIEGFVVKLIFLHRIAISGQFESASDSAIRHKKLDG